MLRARITSKGQITIPVEVRRKFNLKPGDDLIFEFDEKGIKLQAFKRRSLHEFYASLPATRSYPGKEQIREEVAGEVARW